VIPVSSTFGRKKSERVSENADSATLDDVMRSYRIPVVTAYADAEAGDLVALRGSAGYWELAIVQGSAANRLGLQLGMSLRLRSSHHE
jgi:S-adenosylmethionine hydrolase